MKATVEAVERLILELDPIRETTCPPVQVRTRIVERRGVRGLDLRTFVDGQSTSKGLFLVADEYEALRRQDGDIAAALGLGVV